jgi:single-stranded-DNA-specific exonuclease
MTPENTATRWEIIGSGRIEPLPAQQAAKSIPAPILTILANRGITDPEEICKFLHPTLEQLPPPQLLMGMDRAVAILVEAREKRSPVLIHGDYDADGITATALLVKFFREIDLPVYHHLPDRISEGYGLNLESLPTLRNRPGIAEHPTPILLTVDCGITNLNEIAAAKALGFRVIITDHHQPGHELPDAEAIINPHQPGCPFPFRDLAGVGVAFYLAAGVRAELVRLGAWTKNEQPNLKKYLDLVAIGTVADMVPLRGANRILVKIGLAVINQSPGPGLKAMLVQIGQGLGKVTSETIAFQLAPRLNAAGRTGSAEQALQVLLAEEEISAGILAQSLGQANQMRKELSEVMYQEARIQAESQINAGRLVLVVAGEGWYQGIAGLVANKLAREFRRPAVVLALDMEGMAHGSVRSVGNFDILACLRDCSASLDKYGGHRAAAGVTLSSDKVAEFQTKLAESVAGSINPVDLEPRLDIDILADPGEIMQEVICNYLQQLEPYGTGNPEPIFCCHQQGVNLSEVRKVGADSLRFRIMGNGKGIAGIGFGMSAWASVAERAPLRLAYKVIFNNYRGSGQWEIRVEDVKITA